jgi:hypothetical protein
MEERVRWLVVSHALSSPSAALDEKQQSPGVRKGFPRAAMQLRAGEGFTAWGMKEGTRRRGAGARGGSRRRWRQLGGRVARRQGPAEGGGAACWG